ncbi:MULTISPECIES: CbiX/SirB N-terminal domain-containing protein [Haloarcula]|uniref:CbiX/SirB N-terminal domain-containing protein n=1 Tax=Haloarcula TaxID=2237 RepID=UPI0023ED5AC4|nr:CbiX/SirB N-terminal domain-containing protein [Halomicroarcula sp. XH51]
MTTETILLVGRDVGNRQAVLETHASRLEHRRGVDEVLTATYEQEPVRELRAAFEQLSAESVYAVPMCAAHDHQTLTDVPAALSYLSGTVHYCEPIGQSGAVTDVIEERAADLVTPGADATLVIVGFGSSSKPYQRETARYHAARLREQSAYESVLTCYLLQNPAVECVRYNVTTNRAVAVPMFVSRTDATGSHIPDALELERGGIEYGEPFGEHPRLTDAIHAEVEKQRTLASDDAGQPTSFEGQLTEARRPLSTDGEGV